MVTLYYLIIAVMCLAAVIQRHSEKRRIALFYCVMTLFCMVVIVDVSMYVQLCVGDVSNIPAYIHHCSCVVMDIVIISIITTIRVARESRLMVTQLSKMCIVSIMLNIIGLILQVTGQEVFVYNVAGLVLYGVITLIFLFGGIDVRRIKYYCLSLVSRRTSGEGYSHGAKVHPKRAAQ